MEYEPNPKHKFPWQRGRRGSLCPHEIELDQAQALLDASEVDDAMPRKRFVVDRATAYCALQHGPDRWHGFPISWREVPARLRRKWLNEGRITDRDMKRGW